MIAMGPAAFWSIKPGPDGRWHWKAQTTCPRDPQILTGSTEGQASAIVAAAAAKAQLTEALA